MKNLSPLFEFFTQLSKLKNAFKFYANRPENIPATMQIPKWSYAKILKTKLAGKFIRFNLNFWLNQIKSIRTFEM